MRSFLTATEFLTTFLWPRSVATSPEEVGRSATFFPVVGFGLGAVLVLLDWLLDPYLASELLSVILVTLLILMTGARDLQGLGETFEKLAHKTPQSATGLVGSERIRVFGLLAILVVVALKFRAIEVMGEARSQGLLLAPTLARWAMVISALGSDPVDEETVRVVPAHVRGGHLFLTTLFTLTIVVVFSRQLGLWISLWVSLLTLMTRLYLHRRLRGMSGENLGAVSELSETLALVLFASL